MVDDGAAGAGIVVVMIQIMLTHSQLYCAASGDAVIVRTLRIIVRNTLFYIRCLFFRQIQVQTVVVIDNIVTHLRLRLCHCFVVEIDSRYQLTELNLIPRFWERACIIRHVSQTCPIIQIYPNPVIIPRFPIQFRQVLFIEFETVTNHQCLP